MSKIEKLKNIPLFARLSERQLQVLEQNSNIKKYTTGDIIVTQSDPVRAFYLVVSGQIKIFRSSPEGKEQTLYIFGPGEPFCLCAAFDDDGFPASASALEKTEILFIAGDTFERLVKEEPALVFAVVQVLSRRLKEAMQLVDYLALKALPQRVASFLTGVLAAGSGQDGMELELPVTHRELSKMLGSTPEGLSRVFKQMQTQELLQVRGRNILILNWDNLLLLGEGGE